MNHSCTGNVRIVTDDKGVLTVYASVPIRKLKPIKFNYVKVIFQHVK